jgi:hypothetical protein
MFLLENKIKLEAPPQKISFQAEPGNEKNVATFTEKLNIKLIPKIDRLAGKTSVASFARLQRN